MIPNYNNNINETKNQTSSSNMFATQMFNIIMQKNIYIYIW